MLEPFNSYRVYGPVGRDWTVAQLTASYENGYMPDGFPIDGDAMTIAIKERLK